MKECKKCKRTLPLNNFTASIRQYDNLAPRCRNCEAKRSLEYRHSPRGFISQIYSGQKRRNLSRWNKPIGYSKKQLSNWLESQVEWSVMFSNWAKNDYKQEEAPSIDRVDCLKPYSLDNIQLMTWSDNKAKGHQERSSTIRYRSNKTGHRGISFDAETGKYVLQLTLNGERKKLGRFSTIEEAVIAKFNHENT